MIRWEQLVHLPEERLAAFDVAEVNLSCAAGLPGADQIDRAGCLDRLDHYGRCARHYTELRMKEFYSRPEVYDRSEAIFRVVCMITLLQVQFGVRYNPVKRSDDAPFDAADTFVHGALMGGGGTCASLPVVYAAVGRRLGYPLKLVTCARHLFVRWEETAGERFNIEVNDTGTSAHPDDYYRRGRYAVSREIEQAHCFLRSMTPRWELAHFLAQRGCRLVDGERYAGAVEAFAWAARLDPANKGFQSCVIAALNRWERSARATRGAAWGWKSGLELLA